MGAVFRGRASDGSPVAVKRVRLRLDTEGERRRREREVEVAEILAGLQTDHVLPTLDIGRVEEDLFIVMPLASRSLAAALRADDLGDAARLDAVRQVAEGLIDLAAASILHRDLKPANVLDHDGFWKLADFGIARSLLEVTGTYTFLGAGTFPYMAPELWTGAPATVKTDLYALGVTAYEVLTGSRPFAGPDEAAYRRQHTLEAAPTPVGVTAPVARLLLRLLAKEPAMRPQDARAVVQAIVAATKPLEAAQQELRQAALENEQRRTVKEARNAVTRAEQDTAHSRRLQALADLEEILESARDLADEALGDGSATVELQDDGAQWHLRWNDSRVTFVPWPGVPTSEADDPAVVVGAVYGSWLQRTPGANIVCESQGGSLIWSLLRFTASPLLGPNYEYGPLDQRHGFDEQRFFEQRVYMLHSVMHVWSMERRQLDPTDVLTLLREAIDKG